DFSRLSAYGRLGPGRTPPRHHLALPQLFYARIVIANLAQDFLRVLAQHRRRPTNQSRRGREENAVPRFVHQSILLAAVGHHASALDVLFRAEETLGPARSG